MSTTNIDTASGSEVVELVEPRRITDEEQCAVCAGPTEHVRHAISLENGDGDEVRRWVCDGCHLALVGDWMDERDHNQVGLEQ